MSDPSVRSSSTSCCAAERPRSRRSRVPAAVLGCLLLAILAGSTSARVSEDDDLALINPLLGPEYAQWLLGAIGHIATADERRDYLLLDSDQAAAAFVERFWSSPQRQALHEIYQRRAVEADKKFVEGTYPGRRTDRGMIWILYGEPEEMTFEDHRNVDDPAVELWRYSKKSEKGLDGERPAKEYRFARRGDLTRMFTKGGPDDPETVRNRLPPNARRLPPGR